MANEQNKVPESGTVTVACKLPNGLMLHLHDMVGQVEPVLGGGMREFKIARRVGEPVRLKGAAVPFGKIPTYTIKNGAALTPNVDAQFMRRWLDENKDHDAVKNNLIFVVGAKGDLGKVKEMKDVKSGLEPLDMSEVVRDGKKVAADLRVPRSSSPNLSEITEVDED